MVYIAWCKHERESLGEFESLCESEGLHKYFLIRPNSLVSSVCISYITDLNQWAIYKHSASILK